VKAQKYPSIKKAKIAKISYGRDLSGKMIFIRKIFLLHRGYQYVLWLSEMHLGDGKRRYTDRKKNGTKDFSREWSQAYNMNDIYLKDRMKSMI
jgi:hypothetical protein